MKALSIRQPWAWLIVKGFKDIENRDWRTSFRGEVFIHASKTCTKAEYQYCLEFVETHFPHITLPPLADLPKGGIVGSAVVTGCTQSSQSPWFFGDYGFVLSQQKECSFKPLKGQLGFFDMPTHLMEVEATRSGSTLESFKAKLDEICAHEGYTPSDWITWGGGECPLPSDAIIQARLRTGFVTEIAKAEVLSDYCNWQHPKPDTWDMDACLFYQDWIADRQQDSEIIAYRVVA